jgi:hypothetical protein
MKFESNRFFRIDMMDLTEEQLRVVLDSLNIAAEAVLEDSEFARWESNSPFQKIAIEMSTKISQVLNED